MPNPDAEEEPSRIKAFINDHARLVGLGGIITVKAVIASFGGVWHPYISELTVGLFFHIPAVLFYPMLLT